MSEEIKEGAVELGSVIVRRQPENKRRALCMVRAKEMVSIQTTKQGTLMLDASRVYTELTADDATQLANLLLEAADEIRQAATEEGAER
ncbi:hypothetical protein [Bifidobacterium panos]|uniref:Uncharacterized protein n=1 Tax=Bifidobacterium panos TaxID=2675321 RepID=A0ABX1T2E0_9BIFI|nr:hypothetical protein [Bifidobacterium sp. DSM 109963]NMN02813.1 hypothetical protein [Bifidobacterium sp. DSM 109963]